MEPTTTGRVLVQATIENASEVFFAEKGAIPAEQVHRVQVAEALVDTGSTYIGMPKSLIQQLGFDRPYRARASQTAAGGVVAGMYGPMRLTVMDRIYHGDVAEIAEGCSVLIGQLALEGLDFLIDPERHCLIGNPAHHGEHMIEMF
jgi:predicted aspartyl protease